MLNKRARYGACWLILSVILSMAMLVVTDMTVCSGGQHLSKWGHVSVYNNSLHVVTHANQLISLPYRPNNSSNINLPFQVDLSSSQPVESLVNALQPNESVVAFVFMRTPAIRQAPCNLDELELILVLTKNGTNFNFAMMSYSLIEGRVKNISTFKFILKNRFFQIEKAIEGPMMNTNLPSKLIPLWFVTERVPCLFGRIKIMLFYFQIDQHNQLGFIKRRVKIMKNLKIYKMTFDIETIMEEEQFCLLLAFSPDYRNVYLTSDFAQLGPVKHVVPKFRPETTSGFMYRQKIYVLDTERQVVYTFPQPQVSKHEKPEYVFRYELEIFNLSDLVNCQQANIKFVEVNQTIIDDHMRRSEKNNVTIEWMSENATNTS